MAATRLIRACRTSPVIHAPGCSRTTLTPVKVVCVSRSNAGVSIPENNRLAGDGERKPAVVVKAAVCSDAAVCGGVATSALVEIGRTAVSRRLTPVTGPGTWSSIVQSSVEKVITDCRFFTMLAVGGTLLGSVLCFLRGTLLVTESYLKYFYSFSSHLDQGHVMQLLVESLDMFLIGTAMHTFGMALHVMFIGLSQFPSSNRFGNFYFKEIPSWVGMKSITQAKSKIGHALMLLLQVGMLEKFKSIPLVTGLDLVCFAGAVFVSSIGLFVLSKLNFGTKM